MIIHYILEEFYPTLQYNRSIIAVDFGRKKIGLAISTPDQKIALPLEVFISENDDRKIAFIQQVTKKYQACAIVLGYPLNMNGTLSEQSVIVANFAQELRVCGLPIYMQDERLSSKAADNFLKIFDIKRKDRNQIDDKVAASMILETLLGSIAKLRATN